MFCKLFTISVVFLALLTSASAQAKDKSKIDKGVVRAAEAAKVIDTLTALPAAQAIPKELIARAKAIGVFPETNKISILIRKGMKGFGLIARRDGDGWATPTFYSFGFIDAGWTKIKSESPAVIMLFMDAATLKDEHIGLSGAAGPIGEIAPNPPGKEPAYSSIIIYALDGGTLRGMKIDIEGDAEMSGLGTDNNVNKAVFGAKGLDVFWGKAAISAEVPKEIATLQASLATLSKP